MLFYELPDCFFKQSVIASFLYCFDLNQKKQTRKTNKKKQLTVQQLTKNHQKIIDGLKNLTNDANL